ncbi:MAG: carbohydrate binding family 9 domain-containing protein [Bacteroidales bacterium]|nr:carbohydrate binding family 9 domain-containing protein [Bacteroidales bacterium]
MVVKIKEVIFQKLPFVLKRLFISLFIILYIQSIYGQKRTCIAYRVDPVAPQIDGNLDDLVWQSGEWNDDFIQRMPYENTPPSQQTKFKISYDDNNLFIAIRCFDSAPDSIEKRMSRRDGFDGDWVEVNIDSYHDLRTAFSFTVTASGVKGDEAVSQDGNNWDPSWDPIWYVKTKIDNEGWTAEMQIPLTQLRFSRQKDYIWGFQVNRLLYRKGERSSWQFISPNTVGWVGQFGELHGISNIIPKKQVDVVPYVVGKYETYKKENGNPFADGKDATASGGVDGKIGITNDLTLDFTINPDFGQVEADPSEVNLSTFETFFPEKRPFFIEGKSIFNFRMTDGDGNLSSDNLFYSRRIGKQPSRSLDLEDNEYARVPDNTTILGAF